MQLSDLNNRDKYIINKIDVDDRMAIDFTGELIDTRCYSVYVTKKQTVKFINIRISI